MKNLIFSYSFLFYFIFLPSVPVYAVQTSQVEKSERINTKKEKRLKKKIEKFKKKVYGTETAERILQNFLLSLGGVGIYFGIKMIIKALATKFILTFFPLILGTMILLFGLGLFIRQLVNNLR